MWKRILVLFIIFYYQKISSNTIEVFTHKYAFRLFPNVSFGLEHIEENSHQCKDGLKRVAHPSGLKSHMSYTPNRRLQTDTMALAKDHQIQLGFILVLGAHSNGIYNYGSGGSLNGLMSVWDSWVDNFFPLVSNSTSIVLLFDERDYNHQNITKSKSDYIDRIVMKNMGAKPAECVNLRFQRSTIHRYRERSGYTS
jgi:hypothetical protein